MFENEEWKPIDELPHYLISNLGRVRLADSTTVRKIAINDRGFPIVVMYGRDSKTRYMRQINKLVADAFLRPPRFHNEIAVWHKDGDLLNCRADNLMWDTRSRVLEWNEMNRRKRPKYVTPRVRNNRTGIDYDSAYHAAMADGLLETEVLWRIEKQAMSPYDDNARYRYLED